MPASRRTLKTPAADALDVAHARALRGLIDRELPGPWRDTLERALRNVEGTLRARGALAEALRLVARGPLTRSSISLKATLSPTVSLLKRAKRRVAYGGRTPRDYQASRIKPWL